MIRTVVFLIGLSGVVVGNASAQQLVSGCPVLPPNNIWNTPVDTVPVLSNSASMVTTIGASRGFHADFGAGTWEGGPIGIPFITVSGAQPAFAASFLYADESDRGPYAVPLNVPIEGGANSTGDRHAIALDTTNCVLYELYRAFPQSSSWTADSGAIFDLKSNALRPSGWTSADAAGLPIAPGLVTWEEVQSGEIKHAIRFTAPQTRREFVWPARHYASSLTGTQYPRMGERFRLKSSFNISGFPAEVQVILRAMKKYGIILADNGSAWYISGKPDERWNNDTLRTLGQLLGSNFEAVDATVLRISPDSGAALQSGISVNVSPTTATTRIGHLISFAATVSGGSGGVTWSVNDVTGGDATVGTIDATGLYVPPSTVPSPNVVTVRATSETTPAANAAATVTLLPRPTITAISPSTFPAGPFSLSMTGAGFVTGSRVSFDGAFITTNVSSSTTLTATGTALTAKPSIAVSITTPEGDVSNTVFVAVTDLPSPSPPPSSSVAVAISPTSAKMKVRQPKTFVATVTGTTNRAVVWKVNGVTGGNATVGTISSSGVYRAPNAVPSPATVIVSATSVADSTRSATAAVTIRR